MRSKLNDKLNLILHTDGIASARKTIHVNALAPVRSARKPAMIEPRHPPISNAIDWKPDEAAVK